MGERAGKTRKPRHPVESVNNALLLMLMFRSGGPIRISEASRRLGVVPSTAHRLMAMLEYHGFVAQDRETRAYEAGPTLIELGLHALRSIDSRDHVRALLAKLAGQVGETVHFQILEGADVFFVDGIESERPVRTTLRVGDRRPAHCTSGGKAMLADLSADALRALYPRRRLAACTERSITSLEVLEEDLEEARERGYALSISESESEIAAIGVAIQEPGNRPGAFSVSMPVSRYDAARLETLVGKLKSIAAEASRA